MPVPTADPARWDWTQVIGDTLQPAYFVLKDADGAPYDLTSVTGVCQVRTEPGGELLVSPTVTITSPTDGEWTVAAAASLTADLVPGTARYSVRLTFPGGEVRTVLEGRVTFRRGVVI